MVAFKVSAAALALLLDVALLLPSSKLVGAFSPLTPSSFLPACPVIKANYCPQLALRKTSLGRVQMEISVGESVEDRLAKAGITIPPTPAPAANYVPYVITGNLVHVSGNIPIEDGAVKYTGKVPSEKSVEDAYNSARLCGLNVIAQVKAACNGDLNKVTRVVKLVGFVNSENDFTDQPKVINGASDVMIEVFGEAGKHARSALGVNTLPFGSTTEVEAIFEVEVESAFGPGFDSKGQPTALQPGMKVEAVDRSFKDIITVATVKEVKGNQVLIGFDGWGDQYDYWCSIDDGDFQPPGTCMRASARLSPPNAYVGYFDWASYLEETSSKAAPPPVFKSSTVFPSYKGDINFELWQRIEAQVIPMPPTPQQQERDENRNNK